MALSRAQQDHVGSEQGGAVCGGADPLRQHDPVQHALDQGREVFAYPGNVALDWSEGATQLLREGARYCASAENLLEDLDWLDASAPAQSASEQLPPLFPRFLPSSARCTPAWDAATPPLTSWRPIPAWKFP
jgi:hypothetical protein